VKPLFSRITRNHMHWGQNQYFHPDARNFRLCTTSFLLRTPHFFFRSARHEGLRTNDRKQSKILKRGRPPRDPGGIWQWQWHRVVPWRLSTPTYPADSCDLPASSRVSRVVNSASPSTCHHHHHHHYQTNNATTNGVSSHPRYVDMSIGTFDAGQDASRGGTCAPPSQSRKML